MKRRLQRNIALLFVGCAALPLVLVAAIGQWNARRSVISLVSREAEFAREEVAARFGRELRKLKDLLLLLAAGGVALPKGWESRARFQGGDVEYYVADLLKPGGLEREFTAFILIGPDGRPRAKVDYRLGMIMSEGTGQYYLQEDVFSPEDFRRHPRTLGPGLVEIIPPESGTATMMLQLATALEIDNRPAGTLVGVVDAEELLDATIAGVSLGPDAYHFLFDPRSGILLSHPDDALRNQLLSTAMPEVHAAGLPGIDGEDPGWIRFREEAGGARLLAHRRLAGTPWVLGVVAPLQVFLSPIQRVGVNVTILVTLALAASTTGLFLATRHFRRSVADLTEAAAAFSRGNLEHRVRVRSHDEVGAVASAFNRMAEQLDKLIREREIGARFESFNRLSAAVAHDLRGSLFSLSLLVENLDRHAHDPEFLEDAARTLRGSLGRMKRTIAKLTGREPQARGPREAVEVASLLAEMVKASGLSERDDIEVRLDLPDRLEAMASREDLERLFSNLIHNAVEAMSTGGCLTLRGMETEDRRRAVVTVADTGGGMSEEFVRTRLFEPFATTKDGGIGLGLYTCRQIVEQHGGSIEVASRKGEGTRVTVSLPAPP